MLGHLSRENNVSLQQTTGDGAFWFFRWSLDAVVEERACPNIGCGELCRRVTR